MDRKEQLEELLEKLYVMTVEKDITDRNLIEVDENDLEMLLEENFILVENEKVSLSEAGLESGKNMIRRHRLAEKLLSDVLNLSSEMIEQSACEFEHHITEGVEEKVCILLGHPQFCPHNNPIPPGDCCASKEKHEGVLLLSEVEPDSEGVIAFLNTKDVANVQKLLSMGLLPGTQIKLIRNYPSYVFQIGYSQFTIDEHMAENIHIKLQTN